MMNSLLTLSPAQSRLLHAPADDAAAAAADTTGASSESAETAPAVAAETAPSQPVKWWEELPDQQRQYITAKGLTLDDKDQVLPKVIDIASHAEKYIGRGVDTILDKPAKGEDYGEWARKNAAALGLPEKEDDYAIKKPDFWPKDEPWDEGLEKEARSFAFKHGLPPAAFQEFVNLHAQSMKRMLDGSKANEAAAIEAMMVDLTKDWGNQTDARITQAKQGLEYIAEQAGLSKEVQSLALAAISEKAGDAAAIRLFQKVGELLGDDSMVRGGGTTNFGTTPAEARAQLAALRAPGGEYDKATATNNRAEIERLRPVIERLTKIVAEG